MNPEELLNKVKDLIGDGNIDQAQNFIEDHKDELGDYYDQAKEFIGNHDGDVDGLLNKVKGLFGK